MSEFLQRLPDSKIDELLIDAYFQREQESLRLMRLEVQRRALAQEALSNGVWFDIPDESTTTPWLLEQDDGETIFRGDD